MSAFVDEYEAAELRGEERWDKQRSRRSIVRSDALDDSARFEDPLTDDDEGALKADEFRAKLEAIADAIRDLTPPGTVNAAHFDLQVATERGEAIDLAIACGGESDDTPTLRIVRLVVHGVEIIIYRGHAKEKP